MAIARINWLHDIADLMLLKKRIISTRFPSNLIRYLMVVLSFPTYVLAFFNPTSRVWGYQAPHEKSPVTVLLSQPIEARSSRLDFCGPGGPCIRGEYGCGRIQPSMCQCQMAWQISLPQGWVAWSWLAWSSYACMINVRTAQTLLKLPRRGQKKW